MMNYTHRRRENTALPSWKMQHCPLGKYNHAVLENASTRLGKYSHAVLEYAITPSWKIQPRRPGKCSHALLENTATPSRNIYVNTASIASSS
jgi:hypothetical protein